MFYNHSKFQSGFLFKGVKELADLSKTVTVQGSSGEYVIDVKATDSKLQIHCSCEAGIHKRLCKHVIELARTDSEIQPFIVDAGLTTAFDDYFYFKNEVERLQGEMRRLKKKIEKVIF